MLTICVCSLEKAEKRFLPNTCTLYFKIQIKGIAVTCLKKLTSEPCELKLATSYKKYCRVLMSPSVDFQNCTFSKRQINRCSYDKVFLFPQK